MNRNLKSLLPEYLQELKIERNLLPANQEDVRLPYDRIDPRQFELFCCELVRRQITTDQAASAEVIRIEPLAGPGRKQLGADIFCLRSRDNSAYVELFEVKRLERFRPADLRDAVERFKKNLPSWGLPIKRLTIIFSDDIASGVFALWRNEAFNNGLGDVELDLWSRTTLDGLVSSHPDLVYRFFHPAWTERLFGEQAVLHFERFGIYDFEESASWVNFDKPYSLEAGDTLVVHNDYVRLHAFLPSRLNGAATCSVELRNGRFSHVSIALGEAKLVRLYFLAYGSPPESNERPFLIPYSNDSTRWICDLGNCRITISHDEAKALCDAFDTFYLAYEKRMLSREELWRCMDFAPYEGLGEAIPLIEITRGLWCVIRRFAEANDAFRTDGDWSLFDASGPGVKVFTQHGHPFYAAGYHVFVEPRAARNWGTNFEYSDNDVLLVWQPPSKYALNESDSKIGMRHYWDAKRTHEWLTEELIPAALHWHYRQQYKHGGILNHLLHREPSLASIKAKYDQDRSRYFTSYWRRPLGAICEVQSQEQLRLHAEDAQYNLHCHQSGIYLDQQGYKRMFAALAVALEYARPEDFSYLHGNISYLKADDLDSLRVAAVEHSDSWRGACTNGFLLDCVFRCFVNILQEPVKTIPTETVRYLAQALDAIWQQRSRIKFLERQRARLGPNA